MRRTFLAVTALGIAMLAGGAGLAAGEAHGHWKDSPMGRLFMGRIGRAMALKSELNLTDQQKDAIKETLKAHKQEIADAVKPVALAKRNLRGAVLADKSDDAAIRKASDELGAKVGDAAIVLAKVKTELAAKANLTPEQMQKISDFRADNDKAVDHFFDEVVKDKQ